MMGPANLVFFYSLFAFFAIAVNIGSQVIFISVYSLNYAVEISILIGTASGLLTKYILDKNYIFNFKDKSIVGDGQRFFLYALTGVLTTILFWGVEYLFHMVFGTDIMRYTGGVIGLIIGYIIKYQMDKRFVFVKTSSPGGGL